jgi:predicted O-methyltransferase YrrM
MTEALWTNVDHCLASTLLPADPILDTALAANAAAGLPSIDVSPLQGKFLQLLVQLRGARRILEIGTLGGYSTISMARGLPANDPEAHLLSLEFSPKHAAVARTNVAHAGLAHLVEVRVGPALDSLTTLAAENPAPFDLIFLDADKANNPHYLDRILAFTRPGTLILVDNIIRDGEILDATSTDPNVQGQRQTLAKLAANPHLTATAIQTVGAKGWDGFAMALVTA